MRAPRDPKSNASAILAEDVSRPFEASRFQVSRFPVIIGEIASGDGLEGIPSCLDMLVMLPGGSIQIPEPYASCAAVMSFVAASTRHEDALLPDWRGTRHLYLTVDHRRVEPGRTHRNAGWHFDGMQGSRYPRKLPACHQYVCSDAMTTEFSDHTTDATDLDELRHNWFEALGDQIPPNYRAWTPEPLEIVCMSAYQLHRSPVATKATTRTFMRLDVSCKEQDRLGNTLNPVLKAPFTYVERSLPTGLARPVKGSSWKMSERFGEDQNNRIIGNEMPIGMKHES